MALMYVVSMVVVAASFQHSAVEGAVMYTRWGKSSCPVGRELVYAGVAGGSHHLQTGGGANYLCMPLDPVFGNYLDSAPNDEYSGLYGGEYQLLYGTPLGSFPLDTTTDLNNQDVPCAVCRSTNSVSVFMLPGRNICHAGWSLEYAGYLMAERHLYSRTDYACMDALAEAATGGGVDNNGVLFYPVKGRCGALPCAPYVDYREITCAVCSK